MATVLSSLKACVMRMPIGRLFLHLRKDRGAKTSRRLLCLQPCTFVLFGIFVRSRPVFCRRYVTRL